MSTPKKKGLGRGLDALLGGPIPALNDDASAQKTLAVDLMQPGKYQPRQTMDEGALEELANSIRAQGVMQPLLVRPIGARQGGERYEIIAGERRFRAAQLAGLREVPVIVREVDDQSALAMALIENLQREDLSALEEAQGIDRLIREFGLTHEQAAKAVGRSRSATSNLLRLLGLPVAVQTMLREGSLDAGHARALLALGPAQSRALAERIVAEGLSVRDAERLVAKALSGAAGNGKRKGAAGRYESRDWTRAEEKISDAIGLAVSLRSGRGNRGELTVHFNSLEELEGLIERLVPGGLTEH